MEIKLEKTEKVKIMISKFEYEKYVKIERVHSVNDVLPRRLWKNYRTSKF